MVRYFQFLDRYFVKDTEDVVPLTKTGYLLYHGVVFKKFQQDIPAVILNLINDERDGIDVDRELISQAIQSFVQIGEHISKENDSKDEQLAEYRASFEGKFLE